MLTAQELPIVKSILVANKVIDATASDGDVSAAHEAMLQGSNATEYKAQLEAGGVRTGTNWLMVLGLVGGGIALYFIWKNSQSTKHVSSMEYPEPEDVGPRIRKMGRAMGSLRFGSKHSLGRGPRGRMGDAPSTKYEFEPEGRLEGYRKRRARR